MDRRKTLPEENAQEETLRVVVVTWGAPQFFSLLHHTPDAFSSTYTIHHWRTLPDVATWCLSFTLESLQDLIRYLLGLLFVEVWKKNYNMQFIHCASSLCIISSQSSQTWKGATLPSFGQIM
jgi:hypothetical protein